MWLRFCLLILILLSYNKDVRCYKLYPKVIIPHSLKHQHYSLSSTIRKSYNLYNTKTSYDQENINTNIDSSLLSSFNKVLEEGTKLFPIWVLLFSILGFWKPVLFQWFSPYITAALTLTMICMGMTLTLQDFANIKTTWNYIILGFIAQYSIMPLSALFYSKLFQLSPSLSSGLILVGCAPGGTASNLVTLIAQADLALSIMMTTASTIAAVVMTPLLVTKLCGSYVQVKSSDLVVSTLSVVLLPVALGLFLNTNQPKLCKQISNYTPSLSVLLVALICGTISATNSTISTLSGILNWRLFAAIIALHTTGFGVGYIFAKVFKADETKARTISIETGMQNSALAVVLSKHFPNPNICALPGALSATCHSIIGSILAAFWRYQSSKFHHHKSKESALSS